MTNIEAAVKDIHPIVVTTVSHGIGCARRRSVFVLAGDFGLRGGARGRELQVSHSPRRLPPVSAFSEPAGPHRRPRPSLHHLRRRDHHPKTPWDSPLHRTTAPRPGCQPAGRRGSQLKQWLPVSTHKANPVSRAVSRSLLETRGATHQRDSRAVRGGHPTRARKLREDLVQGLCGHDPVDPAVKLIGVGCLYSRARPGRHLAEAHFEQAQ